MNARQSIRHLDACCFVIEQKLPPPPHHSSAMPLTPEPSHYSSPRGQQMQYSRRVQIHPALKSGENLGWVCAVYVTTANLGTAENRPSGKFRCRNGNHVKLTVQLLLQFLEGISFLVLHMVHKGGHDVYYYPRPQFMIHLLVVKAGSSSMWGFVMAILFLREFG